MRNVYACLLPGILCACVAILRSEPAAAQTLTPRYISTGPNSNGFYEYLPAGYDSTKKYPLMVFLNGIGELGNGDSTQLKFVLRNGVGAMCNAGTFPKSFTVNGQTFSFIILMPQFIKDPVDGNFGYDIDTIINYGVAHYAVDTGRIYLTALSEGGNAVWCYASDFGRASRLAAILPIAGGTLWGGAYAATNMAYARLPILTTANINDPVTPSSTTVQDVKTIDSVLPHIVPRAWDTLFNAAVHDAWTETYDPNLKLYKGLNAYQWMLQYSRDSGSVVPPDSTTPPDTTKPAPPDTTQPAPPPSDTTKPAPPDTTQPAPPPSDTTKPAPPDTTQPAPPPSDTTKPAPPNTTQPAPPPSDTTKPAPPDTTQPAPPPSDTTKPAPPDTTQPAPPPSDTTKPAPPDTTQPAPPTNPTPPSSPSTPPSNPTPPSSPSTPPSNPSPPATPPPSSPPAPLTLLSFNARLVQNQPVATVNWAATAGSAKDSFVVEWSKDGRLFAAVDTITATVDTSATGIAYSYADTHVLMGPNYYRLLLIEQNDTSGYSDVKRIDYLPPVYGFHFGPNPATSVLYITLQGASSSPLRVNILDVQGRMLSSWMFPSQGSTLTSMLDISNLAPGSYLLEAITEDSRSTQVFLKQ